MDIKEFKTFWNTEYPEALPINHELKWVYKDRWLRTHSLPESKRYADTDEEYQIIFDRQNEIINDLIGAGTEFIISFGLYKDDLSNDNYIGLKDFNDFEKVYTIDLHKLRPDDHEDETIFEIYIKSALWESESSNEILKAIADDEIRAMFICPSKHCIIAPYDGGVDIIVESIDKKDELKLKYINWLSEREDGM
jgi:hypothetical protein